jgi:hypothetical protein
MNCGVTDIVTGCLHLATARSATVLVTEPLFVNFDFTIYDSLMSRRH